MGNERAGPERFPARKQNPTRIIIPQLTLTNYISVDFQIFLKYQSTISEQGAAFR
jgi:hypothetical protein